MLASIVSVSWVSMEIYIAIHWALSCGLGKEKDKIQTSSAPNRVILGSFYILRRISIDHVEG
jgi:hypothetical protein